MDLNKKHVLVTGASRRIGRAITERFLKEGARVTGHYRTESQDTETLRSLKGQGQIQAIQADLGDLASLRALAEKSVKQFGPIDVLVNSASDFYPTPLDELTEKQWDHFLDINLKGQFFLAHAVAPTMPMGSVVLNICDIHASKPLAKYTPYVVSKAGLWMLTRNLAKEWAPKIRVNSISPGPVLLPESYDEAAIARSIERTLLKRLGSPQDIVEAALFLIQSNYITGFDLPVDGGRSLI
jgi:pteridine reductase